jgi:hypothetical protein
MNKTLVLAVALLCYGCSSPIKEKGATVIHQEPSEIVLGDQYWTLDFSYFYKGKEVKTVIRQYDHRRDCFEAMFTMQKEASKKPYETGAGLCKKLFVEGQERSHKDQLGYR